MWEAETKYLTVAQKTFRESSHPGPPFVWVDKSRGGRILHCNGLSSGYADERHQGAFLSL